MSHSKMLASRRKKQRNRKQLARLEKRTKKLAKINARMGGASAAKNG
ncbi:MAG TPA: hypothetical protein VD839_07770 [Burkholderiales bacterium]|nr:hypothetical protein [Burkholderiales bacterium]